VIQCGIAEEAPLAYKVWIMCNVVWSRFGLRLPAASLGSDKVVDLDCYKDFVFVVGNSML
jgi:hypothetical protein